MQSGGSRDNRRGERPGRCDNFSRPGRSSRRSYSPNELQGSVNRYGSFESYPTWSNHWDSNTDFEPRLSNFDYQHRSTYGQRTHSSSPARSRSFTARPRSSSAEWSSDPPNTSLQNLAQSGFGEEAFSDPGDDIPGGSPVWNTPGSYNRSFDQYDYQHERKLVPATISSFTTNDGTEACDDSTHVGNPSSTSSGTTNKPINVLELANKISSLGPLIRDPRLLTRILKITKTEEALKSPRQEDTFNAPLGVNSNDLQWSKPSDKLEQLDPCSRQSKLSEYSQKYKIVKKTHPAAVASKSIDNSAVGMPESASSNYVLDPNTQALSSIKQADISNVVCDSSNTAENPQGSSPVQKEEENKHGLTSNNKNIPSPSIPSFASKAQLFVKDSFIKLKQEGRAKMSTPTCKTDNKQNQALLKLVAESKDETGNNFKPGSQHLSMSGSNPSVKLPGLKNILNSVMKTSISQVLRNSMDSPSQQKEDPAKYPLDKDVEVSDSENKSANMTEDINVSKTESPLTESEDHISKEPSTYKSLRTNRARKSQNICNAKTMVVTRKQTALSSRHRKKLKKKHFRGGTYSLYLSSRKRKRKSFKEHSQGDDELSAGGTETTGSLLDSEDEMSYASEEIMTTSEKSFQDDEVTPPAEPADDKIGPAQNTGVAVSGRDPKRKLDFEDKRDELREKMSESTAGDAFENVCVTVIKQEPGLETSEQEEHSSVSLLSSSLPESSIMNITKFEEVEEQNEVCERTAEIANGQEEVVSTDIDPGIEFDGKGPCGERAPLSSDHSVCSSPGSRSLSDGEVNKENTPFVSLKQLHSIASSVKTRQRLKRKDTDCDLELNNLEPQEINEPPFKRSKRVQPGMGFSPLIPPHPITNLAKITNSCFPKVDVVYDHKRLHHSACTCQAKAVEARNDDTTNAKIYCQAVDSVDQKLIGCCNMVTKPQLVRPSVKIPFTALCDVHLWRLRHHHCCPICGVFCSQGDFMQCTVIVNNKSQVHLFHICCLIANEELGLDQCPHCGGAQNVKSLHLELNTPTAPTLYLSQKPLFSEPKARMTLSRLADEGKVSVEDSPDVKHHIQDSDRVLSSAGLPVGPVRSSLDKLVEGLRELDFGNLKYSQEELYQAAETGDVEKTLQMLVLGFDPDLKACNLRDAPLHMAAIKGHLAIVHLLIQAGSSVDILDGHLYTPLMLAVENKQTEVAHYLVKAGAQLLSKGEDGMTCLHLAARCGSVPICRMLLETGRMMTNAQDDGGWTPLVWAAEHSHLEIVRLLVERGADSNMRDNEQNIALHWSAYSGNVDISHLFLERGSDLNAANEHGDTPLHIASRQDKYACVVLFLARGANIEARNRENETPIMCCVDPNSQTYMALLMNEELKKFSQNRVRKSEAVIHSDISKAKEPNCIQCVNGVDDEKVPTDYMYVTENCETSTINLDRTITSLQSCQCEDDCTSPSCTCATLSFKCWFDNDGRLLPEFNLADPPMIFECNRACLCWKNCNNRALQHGILCRLQLFRSHNKGWGVRTLRDIPKGTFICEYVGEIITDQEADQREDDSYLFDLDNRQDGETYCLDARYYGNVSRFINHQCEPNLVPVKVFVDHQDLSFPRIAFFSSRDIYAQEELGFDYGEKFWVIKYKSFTCDCGSENCKYSKDTIHQTLENYYRRLKEDHAEENLEGQTENVPLSCNV